MVKNDNPTISTRLSHCTLFPYTTLFRSPTEDALAAASLIFGGVLEEFPRLQVYIAHGGGSCPFLDRKSTRLNSSHRCISYAVFCLKKKIALHSSNAE